MRHVNDQHTSKVGCCKAQPLGHNDCASVWIGRVCILSHDLFFIREWINESYTNIIRCCRWYGLYFFVVVVVDFIESVDSK